MRRPDQRYSLLARLRSAAGLTQEELGERAGLTARGISDIERGLVRRPRRHSLNAVADAIGLDDQRRAALIEHYRGHARDLARTALAQLPTQAGSFAGRRTELAVLDDLLEQRPAIAVIDGMGGIGKTALALHWAHRVADQFPDGLLYADLRGYGSAPPLEPAQVIEHFLTALGESADSLPPQLDARVAAYRSRLNGRRVLTVLDNGRDTDQVRPLLPAGTSSMAIVTSRNQLRGLSVRDGARRITIRELPPEDATAVLTGFIGADRIAAEPAAARELVLRCAGVPLALAVVGDRAARERAGTLEQAAGELKANAGHLLDVLDGDPGDPYSNIRDIYAWSYDALDAKHARVFRLLALHPGHDIDLAAAAALAGATAASLDLLVSTHLLEKRVPGRWEFHDLLRDFAAEQALADESGPSRNRAIDRLLDHYHQRSSAAAFLLWPAEFPLPPGREMFADAAGATAWLTSEHANLIASSVWAAEHGRAAHVGRMSDALWRHLDVGGHYHDARLLHSAAVQAATGPGKASALRYLGTVCDRLGEHRAAVRHYRESLEVAIGCADDDLQLGAHNNLGIAHWRIGDYADARHHLQSGLMLAKQAGSRGDEARVLGNLGLVHTELGELTQAREYQEQALAIARLIGDEIVESNALDELGGICRRAGNYDQALHYHQQALGKYRAAGNHDGERDALNNIGSALRALARYDAALRHHEDALRMARDLGVRHGEATALNDIGETELCMGRPAEAARRYNEAEQLASELGASAEQARAHAGIGDALARLNDEPAARIHWAQALRIYSDLDSPLAEPLRRCLHTAHPA